jgi:hypothetical protein
MLTMVAVLASLLVGAVLAGMAFFAKPQTQQHLDALPWWAGMSAGLVLALVGGGIGVWIIRHRRKH